MAYPKPFPLISPLLLCTRPLCPSHLPGLQRRSEWRTFTNDEGDDPSRVDAAAHLLMEGMEQLDMIIGFKDSGTGIAHELQRTVTHPALPKFALRAEHLLRFLRHLSWCDQFLLPKTISDIAKQLYKRADEENLLRGKLRCSISF
ncbi:hypothetical protein EDB85DRAFT_2189800 [Lactarius pseudohatsudake]|nr:hypothetical protein EDB85DRAFT_2189800 [Lactarius pseudohatsudake]